MKQKKPKLWSIGISAASKRLVVQVAGKRSMEAGKHVPMASVVELAIRELAIRELARKEGVR